MIIYPDEAKIREKIIFDTHAHYDDSVFSDCITDLLNQQKNNGVYGIISCGTDELSSEKTIKLADKFDFLYGAVGSHPENVNPDDDFSYIYRFSRHRKCVAVGEIGLDYHYDNHNRLVQLNAFRTQIQIANELNLPVIVHDRDAHQDTLDILKELKPKGVLHCFSGSVEMAEELLKIGMYIGVGGVITFKNAKKLPDVVKALPKDRLLLETDSPYLSPEPYRGKLCHSGLIPFTALKIAEIRNTTMEEILKTSLENAKRLFKIV